MSSNQLQQRFDAKMMREARSSAATAERRRRSQHKHDWQRQSMAACVVLLGSLAAACAGSGSSHVETSAAQSATTVSDAAVASTHEVSVLTNKGLQSITLDFAPGGNLPGTGLGTVVSATADARTVLYSTAASASVEIRRVDVPTGSESTLLTDAYSPLLSQSGQLAYSRITRNTGATSTTTSVIHVRPLNGPGEDVALTTDGARYQAIYWAGSRLVAMREDIAGGNTLEVIDMNGGRTEIDGFPLAISPNHENLLIWRSRADSVLAVYSLRKMAVVAQMSLSDFIIGFAPEAAKNMPLDRMPNTDNGEFLPVAAHSTLGDWSGNRIVLAGTPGPLVLEYLPGVGGLKAVRALTIGLSGQTWVSGVRFDSGAVAVAVIETDPASSPVVPTPSQMADPTERSRINVENERRAREGRRTVYMRCDVELGTCIQNSTMKQQIEAVLPASN